MKSIADQLPPEIARQIHPDWRKNEAMYWTMRDQLLSQYQGKWIGFADGVVIASGVSPVEVLHAAQQSGRHPFIICVGREEEPCRIRRATFPYDTSYPAGQTLQATALVHEAYLRLVDVDGAQRWNSRGHFFAAAAEAMRRILVENARRKSGPKHGGDRTREPLSDSHPAPPELPEDVLALDEALVLLAGADPKAAGLVKLRYFAGLTIKQSAEVLGMSPRSADFLWSYARARLLRKLEGERPEGGCGPGDSRKQF